MEQRDCVTPLFIVAARLLLLKQLKGKSKHSKPSLMMKVSQLCPLMERLLNGKEEVATLNTCMFFKVLLKYRVFENNLPLALLHEPVQLVHEAEECLKDKVNEKNQIIADENQKVSSLRSEIECKLRCLEPREKEVEAKVTKVMCSSLNHHRLFELNVCLHLEGVIDSVLYLL